jgi:hypothetical protein
MLPNRKPYRAFPVLVLMLVLLLASLPVQAQPARCTPAGAWKIAVLGEKTLARIGDLLLSLWQRGTTKEGVLIDPNGSPNHEGVTIDPDGAPDHEGMSIDPDGHT